MPARYGGTAPCHESLRRGAADAQQVGRGYAGRCTQRPETVASRMATKHNTAIRMPKREGYPSRKPARSPPFCFFSCRPLPCCTGERPTALLSCGWPAEESVEEADELEQLKLDEGRSPGPRFDRAVVISWLMPRVPSARRRNRTMKRRLSIERVHILARRAAWCCALRAALRLRLAFGSADAGAAAAAGLLGAAVAPPPAVDLLGGFCDL